VETVNEMTKPERCKCSHLLKYHSGSSESSSGICTWKYVGGKKCGCQGIKIDMEGVT
jgi:hypothetical protein